jgi:tetratricopeptide (TPR) repeat protein
MVFLFSSCLILPFIIATSVMEKISLVITVFSSFVYFAQNKDELLDNAKNAYLQGNYKDAITLYHKLDTLTGNSGKYASELGQAYYRLQKFEDSRNAYAESQAKNRSADEYFNIGNTYFNEKKYDDAISSYRKALKRNPADKEARHNLSLAMRKNSQKKKSDNNPPRKDENPPQNQQQSGKDPSTQNLSKDNPSKNNDHKKEKQTKDSQQSNSPPTKKEKNNGDIEQRKIDKMLENLALDEMKTKSKVYNTKTKNKRITKPW